EEVSTFHLLSFYHAGSQGYAGALIGLLVFRQGVYLQIIFKGNQTLFLTAPVTHMDFVGIDVFYATLAFGMNLDPRIASRFSFQSRTHNGYFGSNQGYGLTLHV